MTRSPQEGFILASTLAFTAVAAILISGLASWAIFSFKASRQTEYRELAAQIAEAGVEYYRWHLAHAQSDYQDGTGAPGPYTHPYYDKDGIQVGQFVLTITAPPTGSSVVTIRSLGRLTADPKVEETVEVRMGIASLAKYAVVSNSDLRFGEGTEVFGPVHSNGGIRFDGLAHNVVSSARTTYNDPDHGGGDEIGVHTHLGQADPAPPAFVRDRPDVFEAGRVFPVPEVDFAGMISDLSGIKAAAQASGRYFAASGGLGYRILLQANDTFSVYRVNSLYNAPNGCTNSQSQAGWGTWSIATNGGATTFIGNYPIPANGLIFVEDHAWVEGQINTARVTIASGRFPDNPATRTNIIVNNDLLYTNYDGQDSIALMAQDNIHVGLVSDTDLRIDAAVVAQNGRVGRYYYQGPQGHQNRCSPYHVRNVLTQFGTIVSSGRYGFAYSDGTGYAVRNIQYDANLLYNPPPSFPLTSDQYSILSWRRIE